jgi:hypothetical protein
MSAKATWLLEGQIYFRRVLRIPSGQVIPM